MHLWIKLGSIFGGLSVMLGAFGAHSLKERLTEKSLATFQTAVDYQFVHSLALILVGILAMQFSDEHQKKIQCRDGFFSLASYCSAAVCTRWHWADPGGWDPSPPSAACPS